MVQWQYKVVAIPHDLAVMRKFFSVPDPAATAAGYVERVINEHAQDGWEFYRADTISVTVPPGCLGRLLGQTETIIFYNILTFRKAKE
jgi:hypothetical protein